MFDGAEPASNTPRDDEPGARPTDVFLTAPPIQMTVEGAVDPEAVAYARQRVEAVLEHVDEPVLFARVKVTQANDPARERPSIAQATLDIGGTLVRAHVAAHELREAADLMQRRLRDQLEQRASHLRALRRNDGVTEPGEWRHGDLPTHRPAYYDRPVEDRLVLRHKTFLLDDATPDEAAFDMEQLDYDFYLFRELASDDDALLERIDDGTYRLTRLHAASVDPGPTAIALTVAGFPPARATVSATIQRLDTTGEPYVFFEDADTGRGSVVYRRFDGHYGVISPA